MYSIQLGGKEKIRAYRMVFRQTYGQFKMETELSNIRDKVFGYFKIRSALNISTKAEKIFSGMIRLYGEQGFVDTVTSSCDTTRKLQDMDNKPTYCRVKMAK